MNQKRREESLLWPRTFRLRSEKSSRPYFTGGVKGGDNHWEQQEQLGLTSDFHHCRQKMKPSDGSAVSH